MTFKEQLQIGSDPDTQEQKIKTNSIVHNVISRRNK